LSNPTSLGGMSHEEANINCSFHHCSGSRVVS
jgi:hypothetical protein